MNDRGRPRVRSRTATSVTCPNDQNLIAVARPRAVPATPPPQPPLTDRHGHPRRRCRASAATSRWRARESAPTTSSSTPGRVASGNRGPPEPGQGRRHPRRSRRRLRAAQHDRAPRGRARHLRARDRRLRPRPLQGLLQRGVRPSSASRPTTASIQRLRDRGPAATPAIYPGAAPDTGEQTDETGGPRYNTEIAPLRHAPQHRRATRGRRRTPSHVHNNDFYDNALGFTTDVFTAAGHPGFPQDSDLIENNEFYSNNFNPFIDQPDDRRHPDHSRVRSAPGCGSRAATTTSSATTASGTTGAAARCSSPCPTRSSAGPPPTATPQPGCDPTESRTSYRNEFHGNVMGQAPDGTPIRTGSTSGGTSGPAGNTDNCWYDNTGKDGTAASVTSTPTPLPSDCNGSLAGTPLGGEQVAELLTCLDAPRQPGGSCPWFTTPPKPAP